ncbi:MAG: helix-turn-helix domain-containing protein [Clostridia bacterium]|nr:helix-turn-helix domain-containing protein [Clostridia bacterium]
MMFNQYPDLLTVKEACEIMHMSRNTLYELLRDGQIKAFQIHRIWKIPREAIEEYCRRRSGLYKNTP